MNGAGWVATLIFCTCSAIRLARFNVEAARDEGATHTYPYFVGLPTPAAAGIMLLPLLLSFEFGDAPVRNPLVGLAIIAFTSVLMVSRVPTPSLKHTKFSRDAWIAVGLLGAGLVTLGIYAPWGTLALGLAIYLATIPLVVHRSHAQREIMPPPAPVPIFSDDTQD